MRFQPGQSGNPAGRPPGSLNKKTLAFEAAYEDKAEQAVQDIMERAKGGDPAAMRLCMERAVPTGRNRRLAFALPRIKTPEDAEAAIDVVIDALAEGVLTLTEVSELLRLVERLLALANTIRMTKARWAIFFDTPAAQPGPDDDAEGVQDPAPDMAASPEAPADGEAEGDGAAAPLYFPVNLDADEAAEAIEATGGPPAHIGAGDNCPPADALGYPAHADQAVPPRRAAA
jgi:Family of unknown function (DUF5681)